MHRYVVSLFLAAVSLLLPRLSHGGDRAGVQPVAPYGVFSTLSARSVEGGQAAIGFVLEKTGGPDVYRYSSVVAMGLTDRIELGVTLPYVDSSEDGMEDISVSFKHRVFEEGMYGPSVSYLVIGGLNTGTEDYSTDGYIGGGLAVSKRVGPVNGHANILYAVPGNGDLEDNVRFSVGMDFAAAHNFKILGEVYAEKSFFSDSMDRFESRFGYRFNYGEGLFSTLGVGFGMNDRMPDYRVLFSVSVHFPQIERPIERVYEE
jgi:hypothetical protein